MQRDILVWNKQLKGVRVSDAADAWVNRVAHWQAPGSKPETENAASRKFQLVSIVSTEEHVRPLPAEFAFTSSSAKDATAGFADAFPFLVTSSASLRALNRDWCVPAGRAVEMAALRPNIVVEGAQE
jgi:uncharacterized protein YcbX